MEMPYASADEPNDPPNNPPNSLAPAVLASAQASGVGVEIVEKHSLAIRWLHWLNFPLMLIMLWSGLLIYWANDVARIKIGPWVPVRFFGEGFYRALHVPRRLAEGIGLHITFAWLFALNGLAYVVYLTVSRTWSHLLPRRGALRDSLAVVLHDLHLRREAPPTVGYNAAQRMVYTGVNLLGLGALATGVAMYKSAQFSVLTALFGGYETARAFHFFFALGFVLFLLTHVLQVVRAGWNNFRSMIVGAELVRHRPSTNPPESRPAGPRSSEPRNSDRSDIGMASSSSGIGTSETSMA